MLIHFPIALLLVGFLAELLALVVHKPFFKQAALAMLLIGSLGAIAALVSGDRLLPTTHWAIICDGYKDWMELCT